MLEIRDKVPASVAIDRRVVPVREIRGTLVLATDRKIETEEHDQIAFILNRDARFVIRSRDWIEAELDAHYRSPGEQIESGIEVDGISWYWPSWNYLDGDKLVVKTSGWEGSTHWSGRQEFPPDHLDREFWDWLISVPQYSEGLLDARQIPRIKRIWNRYRQRKTSATNKPMDRSGGAAASC
jgi:Type II secretion system (T2SS), protein E, N-terminal domain